MKTITVEEQRAMGIRRQQYPQETPAAVSPGQALARVERPAALPAQTLGRAGDYPALVTEMDIRPNASAHVEVKTDAQDRAWGYLIASIPRTFFFALGLTLVAILATGIGLVTGIVLLIATFAVTEMISYAITLWISPEGTAHFEARQKWAILRYEQRQRWAHYRRENGGDWLDRALNIWQRVTRKG